MTPSHKRRRLHRWMRVRSHSVSFLLGLSLSVALTFCGGDSSQLGAQTDVEARLAALESLLVAFSLDGSGNLVIDGSLMPGRNMYIEGLNVHIRSGSGFTDDTAGGGDLTGLGNLIIGYDEDTGSETPDDKSGSHNLVIGPEHTYSAYGGLIAGSDNAVTAASASVVAGSGNLASGQLSAVTGGSQNTAGGSYAAVSGGQLNQASSTAAAVSGGLNNQATAAFASVTGGESNIASNSLATVSGGQLNEASGGGSAISGGYQNVAFGTRSSVNGGQGNTAQANNSTVLGGQGNTAGVPAGSILDGQYAAVVGGQGNIASGAWSAVTSGSDNLAFGNHTSILGGQTNKAGEATYTDPASIHHAAVAGGTLNEATSNWSVVSGGRGCGSGGITWAWRIGDNLPASTGCRTTLQTD